MIPPDDEDEMDETTRLNEIEGVDEIAAIRQRPAMYIGFSGVVAIVQELIANVLDEHLAGRATSLRVSIEEDGTIEVSDDGGGMAFDQPGPEGYASLAEHDLQVLHLTATARGHAPHVHLLLHGCGLVAVNALSDTLTVQSWRGGVRYDAAYACGRPVGPVTATTDPDGRGTRVRMRADTTLLPEPLDRHALRRLLWDAAHLFPGLRVEALDEVFHAPGGLADLLPLMRQGPRAWYEPHQRALRVEAAGWQLDVAVGWDVEHHTGRPLPLATHAWCNGAYTTLHGSHVKAVFAAMASLGVPVDTVLVHALGREPQFAGPSKDMLHLPRIVTPLRDALIAAWHREEEGASDDAPDAS